MSVLTSSNLTALASKLQFERMTAVVVQTHLDRMQKISSIRMEIQVLLDTIVNVKRAETAYLSSIGFHSDSPVNADGTPGLDQFSTLPGYGSNSRNSSTASMTNIDFAKSTVTNTTDALTFNDQKVSIATYEAMQKLANEDRQLRYFSHTIKSYKLAADRKRLDLTRLLKEQGEVAANV